MHSLVVCGPMIYRTAFMEHLRLFRGDVQVAAQSNHTVDAPALIAHTMPAAALLISGANAEVARHEMARIRKVDLDVLVVWWSLVAESASLRESLSEFDIRVASWETSAEDLIALLEVPLAPVLRAAPAPRVTNQELLVLQLAADGFSNRSIALRLGISENTVKNHFRHISAKFNANSRAQAVWQAVQLGYLTPSALRA